MTGYTYTPTMPSISEAVVRHYGQPNPWDKITQTERAHFTGMWDGIKGLIDDGHGTECIERMMRGLLDMMRDEIFADNYPEQHHSGTCFHGGG